MDQLDIQRSFWKRPEGKVGAVVLPLALVILGGATWIWLLPFMVSILANTLLTLGMGALLVFLIMAAFDKNVQAAAQFLFKRGMYQLTDSLYRIDPVGVLRVAITNMKQRIEDMTELKQQLKQHIQFLGRLIQSNAIASQRSAATAQREGTNKYDKFVEGRQADRLAGSNMDYKAALEQLQGVDKCLTTYIDVTTALAKDSTNEADNLEEKRNNLLKSHRILKAAAKTLKGHEEAMNMFNHGAQIIANERVQLLSEVDNFAQLITDTVGSIDIQAGIIGTDDAKVNEWTNSAAVLERKVDILLLGPGSSAKPLELPASNSREPVKVTGRKSTYFDTSSSDK